MSETEDDTYGSLLFFRKNGEPGTCYPLTKGETCIGYSTDADIRLRIKDDRLEEIHCIIDVADNGIATIFNKSQAAPVCVNNVTVKTVKVLYDKDKIELVGKQFQYINDEISRKDVEKQEALLRKTIATPAKVRQSVAPLVQSTKKTTNLNIKIPVQKKQLARKSFNGNLTPRRANISSVTERPGTTSKLIVSKALRSPTRAKKRRMSMDDIHKKRDRNPKVSERNILLSKNIVSSVISEEDIPAPSLSQKENSNAMDFLDVTNTSSFDEGTSVKRRSSMRTPSSVKVTVTAPTLAKTPKLAGKKLSLCKVETPEVTPSTERVSTNVKNIESVRKTPVSIRKSSLGSKRQKSVGSIKQLNKSSWDRRKTEGSEPSGASKITSVESETLNVLDISLGSLHFDEKQISTDPRLALGKATPRKSLLTDRISEQFLEKEHTDNAEALDNDFNISKRRRSLRQTSSLEKISLRKSPFDTEEESEESENSLETETGSNAGNTSLGSIEQQSSGEDSEVFDSLPQSKKTKQNLSLKNSRSLKVQESEDERRKSSVSQNSSVRRSTKSYLSKTTSGTHGTLSNKSLESSLSSDVDLNLSSNSTSSLNLTVHSTSSSLSDISDIKPIFVPQRRPSLKRTYMEECKDLLPLSRLSTPQTEPTAKNSLTRKSVKGTEEEKNMSMHSDVTIRVSRRRNSVSYCKSCGPSTSSRRSSTSVFERSELERNDSASSRFTPKPRKSLLKQDSSVTPRTSSWQSSSVIVVDEDSVKNTPENNTSIVILDTPFQETQKRPHKLSKTLNSSIEDYIEASTPKLSTKGRRSKSLPYKPVVEEITPVTPLEASGKNDGSFKTPLNTPGLFENIKKSVLRSRGHRRSSHNLMEELNKADANKAVKRARESTGSTDRSPKKKKVLPDTTFDLDMDEDLDSSFASFATEEIFANENSEQHAIPNTPEDFKNLTDKPLITEPQTRSLTEPRKQRSVTKRLSLHAMRLESQLSEHDASFSTKSRSTDDSTVSRRSRRLSIKAEEKNKAGRSPVHDLSDVAGVKKLFTSKSPKNDLTNVPNLRKLMYPTQRNSPKNDLSEVAGVKKLLTTPKKVKSPQNDLRKVPNLRKIMSPKQQNSPKNDLSDVAGLKKLLSTPKKPKEPENDLTNVAGVKQLLSTPKTQKSPLNDLTKVPNLRQIMSPKQQNDPENNLSNVSGVDELFVEEGSKSDIENNKELFDELFVKKPIRTYRGKSMSPITRKAMVFSNQQRRTLGDPPISSPMVEKWLQDQAMIRLEKIEDTKEAAEVKSSPKGIPKATTKKIADEEETVKEKPKPKTRKYEIELDEKLLDSPRSLRSRQKKIVGSLVTTDSADNSSSVSELKPTPAKRGRAKKLSQKEEQVAEVHSTTTTTKKLRGKKESDMDIENIETAESSTSKRTGRLRKRGETQPKSTRIRDQLKRDSDESTDNEAAPPSNRRGKTIRKVYDKNEDDSGEVEIVPLPKQRRRVAVPDSTSQELKGKKGGTKKVAIEKTEGVLDDKENVDEAETGKKTGLRRRKQKAESAAEQREKPVRKGAGRAGKIEEQETDKSKETARPIRRGREKQIMVIEIPDSVEEEDKENKQDNTTEKRETRRKNKKYESVVEAKEPSKRGGRKKIIIEDTEESSQEDVEEKPRTRKQPTKKETSKASKLLQEAFEDSPRTRQKKGNFKKYGSDFLMEPEKVSSKTVRFADSKAENSRKNKHEVETVEKVEETIRRSKRTRK